MQSTRSNQLRDAPTDLVTTARHLGITIVSGQLGPLVAGRMTLGEQNLDEILCPKQVARQVLLLIAPTGKGVETKIGYRALDQDGLRRMAAAAAASGGVIVEGVLALLTPARWLERHGSDETTFAAALAAGWPSECGDNPALFLDDRTVFDLLTQANLGPNMTLLAATSVV